ncbi:MAG: carbonic anhydrase family protein [Pseudomonadota bacterium]
MRKLIALFACCTLMPMGALANDPPAAAHAAAAEPAHAAPAAEAGHGAPAAAAGHGAPAAAAPGSAPAASVPVASLPKAIESIKPKFAPPMSAAALAAKEAEAEAELSVKIATRLAAMRANQAARIAAAAKARKIAAARQKEAMKPKEPAHGLHWTYEGEDGPANWAKINVDWSRCATGNRQSPIDIRDGMKVDLEPIAFDYRPSSFSVVDNGHTVQVGVTGGNYITVANRMYELVQFHFHRPSEERINGRGFEMVVHLVHKDSEGKLAVVAVMLERGRANNLIQTVWNNLPLEKNETANPVLALDVGELLPGRREYFTYMGSLTTPPCSENVLWLVMKEPMQASGGQIALFSRLYPLNARPIQPSAGRMIKESN